MSVAEGQLPASYRDFNKNNFNARPVLEKLQSLLAKSGRTVPSLKSVANSPAFLDPTIKPYSSQIFLDAIPTMHMAPPLANYADLEEAVNQQLETTFYGEQSVAQTIKAIGENTK